MPRSLALLLVLLSFCVGGTAFAQEVKIPKLFKRVTDFTSTLAAPQLQELETAIARFEDTTSTQIAVVILPTLAGESIEDVALRTAELNSVGQKKRDNGVLLLIAKEDKQMRIEVGYGLEGVLPDGLCGQIIRGEIVPHFRNADYYSGIRAGIDAIMRATRNEYKAEPKQKDSDLSWLIPVIFFALFFLLASHNARRNRSFMRRGGPPIFYGGGWGGGGRGGGGLGGFSGGGGSFGGGGASGRW